MGTELPHCQDSANPPPSFNVFLGKASTKPGTGMAESVVATRLTLQVQGRLSFGGQPPSSPVPGFGSPWKLCCASLMVSPVSLVQRNTISLAPGETSAQRGEEFGRGCEKLTRLHFFSAPCPHSHPPPGKPRWRGWTFQKDSQVVQSLRNSLPLFWPWPNPLPVSPAAGDGDIMMTPPSTVRI